MRQDQVQELEQRRLRAAGARPARSKASACLARQLAGLPEITAVVEPVLQLAGHPAPVGRADDQRVDPQQLAWLGVVQPAIAQLDVGDRTDTFGHRLG